MARRSGTSPRSETLARLLDRRVGGLTGDSGRAASAVHTFLLIALTLAVAYGAFFVLYDPDLLGPIIAASAVATALYAAGIALVRTGHQLIAALIAVTTGIAQVVFVANFLGWQSGIQLYLVPGGQLVFLVFTDKQRLLRWAYLVVAVGAFFYCQLVVPVHGVGYAFGEGTVDVLFPINAAVSLGLVYVLAAVSHYRAAAAREAADAATGRAEHLANTDALTGLANRRPVLERLESLAGSRDYCVAIADLDRFKSLNDRHGHDCGDNVLAGVGALLATEVRAADAVGRWGGEEFIFVLEGTSLVEARAMMERMRRAVENLRAPCGDHVHVVTMSVGVATAAGADSPGVVLRHADAALYRAKQGGRNQVVASRPDAGAGSGAEPPAGTAGPDAGATVVRGSMGIGGAAGTDGAERRSTT